MRSIRPKHLPAHLHGVYACAQLLERLESSDIGFDAAQYRRVAAHLAQSLEGVPIDGTLLSLLDALPAASQVYENLQYERRGLCRSPKALSSATQMQAAEVIMLAQYRARARQRR